MIKRLSQTVTFTAAALATLLVSVVPLPAHAQMDSTAQKRAAAKRPADFSVTDAFPRLPFDAWVGERVLFLPKPKGFQDAYIGISPFMKPGQFVPYADLASKSAEVIEITPKKLLLSVDIGSVYQVQSIKGTWPGIVLARDVERAQRLYKGKTLWIQRPKVGVMSEDFPITTEIDRYSKVFVLDVVPVMMRRRPFGL